MTQFILRRLASTIGVLFALSVLVFLIFFAIPGIDPARQIAGRNPTPETLAAVRHTFGLDQPLPLQYLHLMDHLLIRRDLGSYTNRGVNVISELAAATPVTLSLIIGAAVLWVVFSMLIGIVCAVLRNTVWDRGLMVLSLIAVSVPVFWFGQVANLVTQDRWHSSVLFHWIPPLGYTSITDNPVMWFKHLVIPWIVLAASYTGLYARIFRSALIEAGAQDFIRTARSKGMSEARVVLRHLVRTSLGTFASLFALDFGVLVGGGALLVEVVFGLPGVGRLTYQSLAGLDLPVIMATVLYGGFFIVIMNAVVDVLYARLDPRVRLVSHD
jgi:peptide/nickel transport system permease protein